MTRYTKESVDKANEYAVSILGYFDPDGDYGIENFLDGVIYLTKEDIKTLYEASLMLEEETDE